MKDEFIGTVRFLYQVGGKTRSLQPALRSVLQICEKSQGRVAGLEKGRHDGRLAMYVTIESEQWFETKEECESWIQNVASRLAAGLSPQGELSHWGNGCMTAWEKEMFEEAGRAFCQVQRDLSRTKRKRSGEQGSER